MLWSTVNFFHRAGDRVQHELDRNEDGQKQSQKEQDGSEVRSVELKRLVVEGATMTERRNTMEFFRDTAADLPALIEHPEVSMHIGENFQGRAEYLAMPYQ